MPIYVADSMRVQCAALLQYLGQTDLTDRLFSQLALRSRERRSRFLLRVESAREGAWAQDRHACAICSHGLWHTCTVTTHE